MHKHDLDLIAAFADGSLDNDVQARALIESCAECRAEYESQIRMIAMLRQVSPVEMTDLEKAGLHRDLWTELRSNPVDQTTSSPWWYRWSYAVAGLVIVAGIAAGVANLGSGAGTAADFTETGSELGAEGGQSQSLMGDDSAGGSDAAVDTTQAPTTITSAGSAEGPLAFDQLAAEARLKVSRRQLTDIPEMTDEIQACMKSLGIAGQTLVERVDRDKEYLVTVDDSDDQSPGISIVTIEPCKIVYTDS